ncbi:M23 family metallopeptidase [Planctomycetaceae bacterium SH139]
MNYPMKRRRGVSRRFETLENRNLLTAALLAELGDAPANDAPTVNATPGGAEVAPQLEVHAYRPTPVPAKSSFTQATFRRVKDVPFADGSYSLKSGPGKSSEPNIRVTSTQILRDGNGTLVDDLPQGQMVKLGVNFTTQNVPQGARFDIVFAMNGVPLVMENVNATGSGSWYAEMQGWYAETEQHFLFVSVDSSSEIAESDETDNSVAQTFVPTAPLDLPAKLIYPVEQREDIPLVTINYSDMDPRSGQAEDFAGGAYQTDGHVGWDIGVAHFGFQDRGIGIVAAAGGVVSEAVDGNTDRNYPFLFGSGNAQPNYVIIEHGNGWQTRYSQLARDSVTVSVGDQVTAGQIIGNMGSSGPSDGTHLAFTLLRQGMPVESMVAPEAYFIDPTVLVYQPELPTYALDAAFSIVSLGGSSSTYLREGLPIIEKLDNGRFRDANFTTFVSHLNPGDETSIIFTRPNGTIAQQTDETHEDALRKPILRQAIPANQWMPHLGTWQVRTLVNGEVIAERNFEVVTDDAPPVFGLGSLEHHPSGLTSPVAYVNPRGTFVLRNFGDSVLELGTPMVPDGFILVSAPTSINPSGSPTMRIDRVDTFGSKSFGVVRIPTNDPNFPEYTFNIEAVSNDPGGFTTVTMPGPAVAYRLGNEPMQLDATAEFDSLFSPAGELRLIWEGGRREGDLLTIEDQGNGEGQIGVEGNAISFAGTAIGTITSGGSAPDDLIIEFNSEVAIPAVTALLRAVNFSTTSTETGPRFIRAYVVDIFDEISTHAYKSVRVHGEAAAPIIVESIDLPDNDDDRSMLQNLTVQFDQPVAFGANAFEVIRRDDQATVGVVVDESLVDGKTVATLSFTGPLVAFGSLADGNYQLRINADQIFSATGGRLSGDGDGGDYLFGDEEADGFYRLFGDINGDREVGFVDFLGFRSSFDAGAEDPNFEPAFDYNQDDSVGFVDFLQFRNRFGDELPFV